MKTPERTRQRILVLLEDSRLTQGAFRCRFDLDEDTPISIESKERSHHYFVLRHRPSSLSTQRPWVASESPGPVFRGAETTRFEQFSEGVDYMTDWLGRVVEELAMSERSEPSS